jgi:hypothetical protein
VLNKEKGNEWVSGKGLRLDDSAAVVYDDDEKRLMRCVAIDEGRREGEEGIWPSANQQLRMTKNGVDRSVREGKMTLSNQYEAVSKERLALHLCLSHDPLLTSHHHHARSLLQYGYNPPFRCSILDLCNIAHHLNTHCSLPPR